MRSDQPAAGQIPALLRLWKAAFGEYNGFWELFLETAFSPERCRCIILDGQPAASLCWFDCFCGEQKIAYVYAVVTHPDFQGKGLCRQLLAEVHSHLAGQGYAAALLVPAEEGLRDMYRKLGYRDCTAVSEFSCTATAPISLRAIGPEEYARLRRRFLPEGGVVQEGENLRFLARQAQFFAGEEVLLAAYTEEDTLQVMELLGNAEAAPAITAAMDCREGHFRTPGTDKPFGMLCPLTGNAPAPAYFGFAFD